MTADLSGMNAALPDGATQTGAVLDDYLRETRQNLKDNIDVEHSLVTGRHKFPSGNTAARPISPTTGSLFINTQTGTLEWYNGTTWISLGGMAESVNYAYNGSFEIGNSGGVPSYLSGWTLTGGGDNGGSNTTITPKYGERYGYIINTSATPSVLYQDVDLLYYGIEWWKNRTVTFGAWISMDDVGSARISIGDGIGTTVSTSLTAIGPFIWLQVTHIISASATRLRIQIENNGASGDRIFFDGARLSIGNYLSDYIVETFRPRTLSVPLGNNIDVVTPGTKVYLAGGLVLVGGLGEGSIGYTLPYKCRFAGWSITTSGPTGGGYSSAYLVRNGGASIILSSSLAGPSSGIHYFDGGGLQFAAGDRIDIRLDAFGVTPVRWLGLLTVEEVP